MATDASDLTTTDSASPIENPMEAAGHNSSNPSRPIDPSTAAVSTVSSPAEEEKGKGDEVSKSAVAKVESAAEDGGTVTDVQKKIKRAERFGVSVKLSEDEKRNSRAERFGSGPAVQVSGESKKDEELKRKARAERFGLPVAAAPAEEEAKKKARLAKFGGKSKTDAVEEDKRKARALRFSESASSISSETNGKGNIEPKSAIAGKAV